MIAVFKNKLFVKFDKAIKDAEVSGCEIVCFKLESEEENQLFQKWMNMTSGYMVGVDYDYEGILVREFSSEQYFKDIFAAKKSTVSNSKCNALSSCPFCKALPYAHQGYFEVLHKRGCFFSQELAVKDPMPIYAKDLTSWNRRN